MTELAWFPNLWSFKGIGVFVSVGNECFCHFRGLLLRFVWSELHIGFGNLEKNAKIHPKWTVRAFRKLTITER